jgi:hypothetical protein
MGNTVNISTSEDLIRELPLKVLSVYYFMYSKNINGVLFKGRDTTAKKLGISSPTLFRYLKLLREYDMLQTDQHGNQVLIRPKEWIRRILGYLPSHKCTLHIPKDSTVQSIKKLLQIKLLERLHRQAKYSQRETMIKHQLKDIHSESIRKTERVKLRKKIAYPDSVPLAGSTIADNLGMSIRAWKNFQKELIATGYMSSTPNKELVMDNGKPMVIDSYGFKHLKEVMGNNIYHTYSGNVIKVNPNLISIRGYMDA